MQEQLIPKEPFQFIKVRSLIGWCIYGLIISIIVSIIIRYINGIQDSFRNIAPKYILYIFPLLWVKSNFTDHKINPHDIIGTLPKERKWFSWIMTVAALYGFSVGSIYLIWYPLSFLAPSFTERILSSNSISFSYSGIPKPFACLSLEFILVVLIAPFVEELCFRGIILHRWAAKWGLWKGIVLSSLLFGAGHKDFIGASMAGFVMAVLYIRTQSLSVPTFCHTLNNAVVYIIEGIEYVATGPVPAEHTIDGFRSDAWIGIVCLGITVPWLFYYIVRNRPKGTWRMPYESRTQHFT